MNQLNFSEKIEILPEHIIDQIKAGEVLERPASLLKELIENSIDAESTEINIQIVDNGLELISIEDNGKGMDFQNLPYAFLRHATSKLKTFEDLYRLHSFGFRGEALASIAASARVTCQSQPRDLNLEGGKLIINGGLEELLIPMKNSKAGTSIYIKNLFFNTPARLKFIKSKNSERIQLKKIINSFLVSNPQVQMSIKWDEKEKDVFKIAEPIDMNSKSARISQVFYPRQKNHAPILFGESQYDGHKVKVFLATEALKNSPNKQQYLFANNRLFFDKNIHQSIVRHFDYFWKFGESGHYAVFIETPTDEIDVNVHPNKTQIKFSKSDVIHSLLSSAIKNALDQFHSNKTKDSEEFQVSGLDESPMSFISREDLQFHSLENLKNKIPETGFIAPSIPIIANRLTLNTRDFFIFHLNEQFYLASKLDIIASYLFNLINECLNHDEMISPLLISEPFNLNTKIDPHLLNIKRMGFEFDRLNPEVIVLRTIPKNINRSLIKISILTLFEALNKVLSNQLTELILRESMKKINFDLMTIDVNILFKIIDSNPPKFLALCKTIDNNSLEKLYHE